ATGRARFLPWAVAGAAVFVVLVTIPQFSKQPAPGQARDAALARGDFNHDHHVDILDAFALARQLKQGGPSNLQLDVNGDGVVDERDVEALAARAVKLGEGGHS
ncbi:MAG: dockerin type I domain-containing protein, partial [Verrucomicrobia bacterium]|nr:dockerin type I domain-containing protein [Verrucomicrobiota bacterium]